MLLATTSMEFATQNFEELSKGLNGQTLMMLGGAGLILWYFFGNKLGDIKGFISSVINKVKPETNPVTTESPKVISGDIFDILSAPKQSAKNNQTEDDVFFKLIVSWKQTRDLAVKAGCDEAIEIADQMFPHLSVNACGKDNK